MKSEVNRIQYPLWGFSDSNVVIITRGETQDQAYKHAEKSFPRGATIAFDTQLPIDANIRYSENHPFDWLNQIPRYLQA